MMASTIPTTATSPIPVPLDPIEELAEQISKLTISLKGQPRQQSQNPGPATTSNSDRRWQYRCMWCDSMEHTHRNCSEFTEALNAKLVEFNEIGIIKVMSAGKELLTLFGKGGMT